MLCFIVILHNNNSTKIIGKLPVPCKSQMVYTISQREHQPSEKAQVLKFWYKNCQMI